MTNREKLIQFMKNTFEVKVDVDKAGLCIANCAYLKCPSRPYAASCSKCEYNGFWKQEYDASKEDDVVMVLGMMRHILGLSQTEKEALDYAINYIQGDRDDN